MGLTFDARKSFRGRVRVAFGEPIAVPPYLAAYHEDAVTAVDAMTTAIQWGMQAQVLHLERQSRQRRQSIAPPQRATPSTTR